jgi:cytochrome P450
MLLWTIGNTSGSVGDVLLLPAESGALPDIAANPNLVAGAVDEVLRVSPSFPGIYRDTTVDVVFDGSLFVPAGSRVMGWVTAAHRDPTVFPDPQLFDIRRSPNEHLAFGRGAHHCLGAGLVRAELASVLAIAACRLPNLRRDPDHAVQRRQWIEDTVDVLHMRFDPPAN